METSMGTIKIELFQEKAPISVANFLKYVDKKHYDGTTFHRVMPDFMIQGGGDAPAAGTKPSRCSPHPRNEGGNGLKNNRRHCGHEARTPAPNSATAQFFINVVDNPFLSGPRPTPPDRVGYAVFGRVIDGMDVVDRIEIRFM